MKEEKKYTCICGKEFNEPQKFNAHKSHCKEHYLQKYGDLDVYENRQKKVQDSVRKTLATKSEQYWKEKEKHILQKIEKWVSEKHICEKCGKVMTEYYGSGRFCSSRCSHSGALSDENKLQISKTPIKTKNPQFSNDEVNKKAIDNLETKNRRAVKHKIVYNGPTLPKLKEEKLNPGYQSRKRIPYSEQFWKTVLDNNKIKYKMNVPIWKPGLNNYWLDFLIDDTIDLEIDGDIHNKEEVKIKDKIRTEYLESKGYTVYRIKWVNPISEKSKIIVNQQIDDLLNFLNKPRLN